MGMLALVLVLVLVLVLLCSHPHHHCHPQHRDPHRDHVSEADCTLARRTLMATQWPHPCVRW